MYCIRSPDSPSPSSYPIYYSFFSHFGRYCTASVLMIPSWYLIHALSSVLFSSRILYRHLFPWGPDLFLPISHVSPARHSISSVVFFFPLQTSYSRNFFFSRLVLNNQNGYCCKAYFPHFCELLNFLDLSIGRPHRRFFTFVTLSNCIGWDSQYCLRPLFSVFLLSMHDCRREGI